MTTETTPLTGDDNDNIDETSEINVDDQSTQTDDGQDVKEATEETEVKTDNDGVIAAIEANRLEELQEQGVMLPEEADEPAVPEPEPETEHVMKVDGKKVTATTDEIKTRLGLDKAPGKTDVIEYQKQLAADKRFNELGKKQAELDEREARIALQEQLKRDANKTETPPAQAQKPTPEMMQKLSDALLLEDGEAAANIFAELVPGTTDVSPGLSESRVAEITAQTIQQTNVQTAINKAVKRFATEYEALDQNPILRQAVDARSIEIHQSDKTLSPWEVVEKAAKDVQAAFGQHAPTTSTATEDKKRMVGRTTPGRSTTAGIKTTKPPLTRRQQIDAEIARSSAMFG